MELENVERGMVELSLMQDDGGLDEVDLGALVTKASLDSEEARAVLSAIQKAALGKQPFESFTDGKPLPTFVLFGTTERQNMRSVLVNNQICYDHTNTKLTDMMLGMQDALPVFDIVSLVLPANIFLPGQKTIGDIQHGTDVGYTHATALYLLSLAMSDTSVGTPSMRLVENIPFPRYTDMVTTFGRKHRKVTLLMERLVRDNAGIGEAEDVTEAFSSSSAAAQFVLNREDNMAGVRFMWLVHDPEFHPDEAIRCTLHANTLRLGGLPKTGTATVSDEFMKRMYDTDNMNGEQRAALEKRIKTAITTVRQEETRNEKHAAEAAKKQAHGTDPFANARNITNMLALNNCVFAPYLGQDNAKQGSQLADVFLSVDVHTPGAAIPSQEAYDMTTFKRAFELDNPVVQERMRMMGVCALQCDDTRMFFDISHGDAGLLEALNQHGILVFSPLIPACVSMADMAQCNPEYIAGAPPPWNTITAVEAKLACYEAIVEKKENARLAKKNGKRRARMTQGELGVLQAHRAINDMLDATHSTFDQWDEADENLTEAERKEISEFRKNMRRPVDENKRYVALGASARLVGHNPHEKNKAESSGVDGDVTLRVVSPLEDPRNMTVILRKRISHIAPHLDREAYDDLMESFRARGRRALEAVLVRDTRHTVVFNTLIERYHKVLADGRSVCYAQVFPQNTELSDSFYALDYVRLRALGVTNEIGLTRDLCLMIYRSSSDRETELSTGIGNGTLMHIIWLGKHGIGKSHNTAQAQKKMFVEGTIAEQGTGSRRANTDIRPNGDGADAYDEAPAPLMGASSSGGRVDPDFAAQESEWKQRLSENKLFHNICSLIEGTPGMTHEEKALFGRKRLTLERRDKRAVCINANLLGENEALLDRFLIGLFEPPTSETNVTAGMVSEQIPSFEHGARGGFGASTKSEAQLTEELRDVQMLNAFIYAAVATGFIDPPNVTMFNLWNPVQRNLVRQFPFLHSKHRGLGSIPTAVAIQEAILHGIKTYQNTFVSGGFKIDLDSAEVREQPFDLSHLQYISRYSYLTESAAIKIMIRHTLTYLVPTYLHRSLALLAKAFCGYTMVGDSAEPAPQEQAQRAKMTYLNIRNSDTGTHDVDYEIITGPVRWHDMIRVLCESGQNEDIAKRTIRLLSQLTVLRSHTSGYNSTPDGKVQAFEYVPSKVKKPGFKNEEDTGHGQIRISLTALYKTEPKHLIQMILKTVKTRGFRTHSHLSTPDNPVRRMLLTGLENKNEPHVIGTTECSIDSGAPNHVMDYRDSESRSRMQDMLLTPDAGFCVTERSQRLCQRAKERKYVRLHENGMYHYPELEKHLTAEQRAEFDLMDRETRDSLACNFYVHGLDYDTAYAHTPLMMTRRNIALQEILFKKRIDELRSFTYPESVSMVGTEAQERRGAIRSASRAHESMIWDDERSAKRVSSADRLRYVARTVEEEASVIPAGADSTGQVDRISDLTVEINRHAEKIAAVASRQGRTAASLTSGMFGFD